MAVVAGDDEKPRFFWSKAGRTRDPASCLGPRPTARTKHGTGNASTRHALPQAEPIRSSALHICCCLLVPCSLVALTSSTLPTSAEPGHAHQACEHHSTVQIYSASNLGSYCEVSIARCASDLAYIYRVTNAHWEFLKLLRTMSCPTLMLLRPSIRAARIASRHPIVFPLALHSRFPSKYSRSFASTTTWRSTAPSISPVAPVLPASPASPFEEHPIAASQDGLPPIIYTGPMTATFRRLKIFSLSSCALTVVFTPFLFVLESSLPAIAQASLAVTALTTTFLSTALVGWTGRPYVTALRRTSDGVGLELHTMTMTLRPRTTSVYDPAFLAPTRRPFAAWQLASTVHIPANAPVPGTEETVAETRDEKGEVCGRWIVTWGEGGEGTCHESGKAVRSVSRDKCLYVTRAYVQTWQLLPRPRRAARPISAAWWFRFRADVKPAHSIYHCVVPLLCCELQELRFHFGRSRACCEFEGGRPAPPLFLMTLAAAHLQSLSIDRRIP
jgi:hypothetical protein